MLNLEQPLPPIVFEGERGPNGEWLSIIDGGDTVNGWVPAPEIGTGVYKTTSIGYEPYGMVVVENGKTYDIPKLCHPNYPQSGSYCNSWQQYLAKTKDATETYSGVAVNFWDGIEALYLSDGTTTYIRFRNYDDPNQKIIRSAKQGSGVGIFGSSYIVIKNFEIRATDHGITIGTYGSTPPDSLTIENNKIINGRRKISAPVSNSIIQNNVMYMNGYAGYKTGHIPGSWIGCSTYACTIKYHIYDFYKYPVGASSSGLDEMGIILIGNNNKIYNNRIYETLDGIIIMQGDGNEVSGNVIHDLSSGGFYIDGRSSTKNTSFHDNLVYDVNIAFRLGDFQGGRDEAYIYRNKFWLPQGAGRHIFYHFNVGSGIQTEFSKIWWYHNSFSGGAEFSYVSENINNWGGNALKNVRYVNNIMSSADFENNTGILSRSNFVELCSYNWMAGQNINAVWCDATNIKNGTTLMWDTPALHDFALPQGTNAKNAGIDLSKSFTTGGNAYSAFPGMSPGYFSGSAPDIGAVQTASENLVSKDISRISHPAYDHSNLWQTHDNPWNLDYTRILMYEGCRWEQGSSPAEVCPKERLGKGYIWGFISELKIAVKGTQAQYDSIVHKITPFPGSQEWAARGITWSIFPGEENIIYGVHTTTKSVSKLNTDTGERTYIISYNPGDGTDISRAALSGWSSDAELIINLDDFKTGNDQYRINLDQTNNHKNPTRIRTSKPALCTQDWAKYQKDGIHNAASPDKKYTAWYGGHPTTDGIIRRDWQSPDCSPHDGYYSTCDAGCDNCDTNTNTCRPDYMDPYNSGDDLTHIAWTASNDWFVGGSVEWKGGRNYPHIANHTISQVFFDRITKEFRHNTVLTYPGAGLWSHPTNSTVNYHAMITPTLRKDGRQIMFQSTDGLYSTQDFALYGSTPWGTRGVFLADLVPSSSGGSDTQPPSIPANPTATIISSGQINLFWSASTDNVGVTGYKIYRDGFQIATSQTTSHSDTSLTPSTTYSYTVSSYDSAGNNSSQSNTISATTQSLPSPQSAYTILKAVVAPTIDGDLIEYANANSITFSTASGGNTVTVKALWDSQALYLGYEVADTQFNGSATTRDSSVWNDDSIEWFIDTLNNKGGSSSLSSPYMLSDDYHGIINILNAQYDSQGTVSGSPSGSWNGAWQSAVKLAGTANNNGDLDSKYFIEVKILWTSVGFAPADNTVTGMSFAVNDKDISSRSYLMWPDITTAFENASKWQNVLLSGNSAQSSDTQATSVPTNPKATAVSSSQIDLSWAASTDDTGVAGYKIYRGGVQIAATPVSSYSNTGLSPSIQHIYTVSAYDAAGNVSAQSSSVSATTQAVSSSGGGTTSSGGGGGGGGTTSSGGSTTSLDGATSTGGGVSGGYVPSATAPVAPTTTTQPATTNTIQTPASTTVQTPSSAASRQSPHLPVGIPEGSLVRGPDGIKVYIVNYYGYRRHIFNPAIFNMYGHFKWDQIKEVDRQTLDSLPASDFYRADSDTRVFSLKEINEADGLAQKRWMNISGEKFTALGYKWEQVFIINTKERDYYQEGTPLSEQELVDNVQQPTTVKTQQTQLPAIKISSGMLVKSPENPTVYYITPALLKKPIPSLAVFNSYSNQWANVKAISPEQLNSIETVTAIKLIGSTKAYLLENSAKRWVKTQDAFHRLNLDWNKVAQVNQAEFNYYPEVNPLE